MPGLPPAVRLRLHLGHAHQPLRPARQLRPDELARAARADPQVPRRRSSKAGDEVVVWGTGAPRREFLHVDDLADACVFLMRHYDEAEHINVGTGEDLTIRELAELVRDVVHPAAPSSSSIAHKPDGTPRKLLDVSRLHALGWRHKLDLREGIDQTYAWFVDHQPERPTSTEAAIIGSSAASER